MTKEELVKSIALERSIEVTRIINRMVMEMNSDRNDGWVKEHYKQSLRDIRDMINKSLEKE